MNDYELEPCFACDGTGTVYHGLFRGVCEYCCGEGMIIKEVTDEWYDD